MFVSRFPERIFFQVYCTVSQTSLGRIWNTFISFALMLCSYGIIVWGLCLPSLWLDKTGNLDLFKSQKGTLPMTVMTVSCSYHLEQGTCSLHPELNRVNMAHEKLRPTLRTSPQTCPIVFATLWRGLDIEALIWFIFLWHQYSWFVGAWFLLFQVKIFFTNQRKWLIGEDVANGRWWFGPWRLISFQFQKKLIQRMKKELGSRHHPETNMEHHPETNMEPDPAKNPNIIDPNHLFLGFSSVSFFRVDRRRGFRTRGPRNEDGTVDPEMMKSVFFSKFPKGQRQIWFVF